MGKFNLEKAKQKYRKHKTVFCSSLRNHKRLVKWMDSHKPFFILNRPVWIIPHAYVKNKVGIRPFGLMFISRKVPRDLIKALVYHEITEERAEPKLGRKKAHCLAVKKEGIYLRKRGLVKKVIKWLTPICKKAAMDRSKAWDI